jgi:RNA polymerase sigma-32 factor
MSVCLSHFDVTTPSLFNGIDGYVAAIKKFPILSKDQEVQLSIAHRDRGDINAAHALVTSHLRVVVTIARGYSGYGLPMADLIQEGNIGLMKAVKRYDPNVGVRLISFAMHFIKAEINEFVVRNWRLVKIATTKAQRKLFFNLRSMKQTTSGLSRSQATEIASQLNVTVNDVMEMDQRFAFHESSIDSSDNDVEIPLKLEIEADEICQPLSRIEQKRTDLLHSEGIQTAIDSLDERSKVIIQERWLSDNESGATLKDLAERFGVSMERIRQIEKKAFEKMKTILASYY